MKKVIYETEIRHELGEWWYQPNIKKRTLDQLAKRLLRYFRTKAGIIIE